MQHLEAGKTNPKQIGQSDAVHDTSLIFGTDGQLVERVHWDVVLLYCHQRHQVPGEDGCGGHRVEPVEADEHSRRNVVRIGCKSCSPTMDVKLCQEHSFHSGLGARSQKSTSVPNQPCWKKILNVHRRSSEGGCFVAESLPWSAVFIFRIL